MPFTPELKTSHFKLECHEHIWFVVSRLCWQHCERGIEITTEVNGDQFFRCQGLRNKLWEQVQQRKWHNGDRNVEIGDRGERWRESSWKADWKGLKVKKEEKELWEDGVFNFGHLSLRVNERLQRWWYYFKSNLLFNSCTINRWTRKKI